MPVNISGNGLFTGASSINGLTLPTDSFSPGLVKITDSSFSAASSVSVNNCFTSTYDNYLIVMTCSTTANAQDLFLRLRASGSDNTSSTYTTVSLNVTTAGVQASGGATGQTAFTVGGVDDDDDANCVTIEVFRPQLATRTNFHSRASNPYLGLYARWGTGYFDNSTQFDGFTIYPGTNNITGTLRVYGYRN